LQFGRYKNGKITAYCNFNLTSTKWFFLKQMSDAFGGKLKWMEKQNLETLSNYP